jgi:hypothetical protein
MDLRAQVFERLNTGGERLNPQELRNSLYSGSFNKLVVDLASRQNFTDAWDIPSHAEHTLSDNGPDAVLKENNFFKRMLDVEIVLRFFAFRDMDRISGSVRAMLDGIMKELRSVSSEQVAKLDAEYTSALESCLAVFGDQAFRLPSQKAGSAGTLSRPLYDAQMVALDRLSERRAEILTHRGPIKLAVGALASPGAPTYDLMIGRANTAATIRDRIQAVEQAILGVL